MPWAEPGSSGGCLAETSLKEMEKAQDADCDSAPEGLAAFEVGSKLSRSCSTSL